MRALISVYDKQGLVEFAAGLVALGCELVASGNTAETLRRAGVPTVDVAQLTGAPEMLDGRVKTLHPTIHAAILADRSKPEHLGELARHGIEPIDLVVCNLYPFFTTPSIETIDVGGPTLLRAAAKNHEHVAVVSNPGEYPALLDELQRTGSVSLATRKRLARAAFAQTATYDAAIVSWFDDTEAEAGSAGGGARSAAILPLTVHLALERAGELRYGENPHQAAARYRWIGGAAGFWDDVVQFGGRELSYLNLVDGEAAWRLVHELAQLPDVSAAAVVVKHANPCGAAVGHDLAEVYEQAFAGDPTSAFGGIVALSGAVDLALAERIVAHPQADVLIASGIDEAAQALFARRRPNMRPLLAAPPTTESRSYRQIAGGFLIQEPDRVRTEPASWKRLTGPEPSVQQWRDAELAHLVCGRTLSNAIVLTRLGQVVGVGCGQQSRVDAAAIAVRKAEERAVGAVAASDAFFPFRDGVDVLIAAGASVIVQPGGSVRDEEVAEAARAGGVTMLLSGERHFRH